MFSKSLYADKADPKKDEDEMTPEEIAQMEREEEAEYLGTLNNFHWVMYPFFKTVETICDKIFGCKKKAQKINEEAFKKKQEEQRKRNEAWEQEKQQIKEMNKNLKED